MCDAAHRDSSVGATACCQDTIHASTHEGHASLRKQEEANAMEISHATARVAGESLLVDSVLAAAGGRGRGV